MNCGGTNGTPGTSTDIIPGHVTTKPRQHWHHDHIFGQDKVRHGERRTLWVIVITATMMVIEIATGLAHEA